MPSIRLRLSGATPRADLDNRIREGLATKASLQPSAPPKKKSVTWASEASKIPHREKKRQPIHKKSKTKMHKHKSEVYETEKERMSAFARAAVNSLKARY